MVLYRVVFQAKVGKAAELVAAFKSLGDVMPAEQLETVQPRVLTDISGPTDTVVLETTHESLAAVEEYRKAIFASGGAAEAQDQVMGLVRSARNEYYTIET